MTDGGIRATTRCEQVTVYARGARVRRVTTISAPLPTRVRIVGLPLAVIDDTLRVEVGGPAVVTTVQVGIEAPELDAAAGEEAPELLAARRTLAHAEAECARLEAALAQLAATAGISSDPAAPAGTTPPPAWAAVVAARRSVVELRAARARGLDEEAARAGRALEEARQVHAAAVDRDRRGGSARPPRLHELRKYVDLELAASASSEVSIHVEYQVAAARWAPSYVARIEGEHVRLELRAVVAQHTGEDWSGVALCLSTAEPEQFSQLPELAPQRIGRRVAAPARPGFRPPPSGAEALYADYAQAFPARAPAPRFGGSAPEEVSEPAMPHALPAGAVSASQVWDEDSSRGKEAFSTPPAGVPMPAKDELARKLAGPSGPAQAAPARLMSSVRTAPAPAPVVPRLDYGNLRMPPANAPGRGMLRPAPPGPHASTITRELASAALALDALVLPPGCQVGWSHAYDHAYATEGAVDIAADAAWHAIAVTAKPTTAKLRHVAVPRVDAAAFRVAALTNPFAGPLLPGPIEVYDRGKFLVSSTVEYTPAAAQAEIGLGVDPTVKIARNTEFREEAAGMLRGVLRLHHSISVDVENLSGRGIELELRERLPVAREGDDDIELVAGKIEPAWEPWAPEPGAPGEPRLRGGHRWRLSIPAGAKRSVHAAYEIKIGGKLELVGGNRREP